MPTVMTAERARDIGRLHQALSEQFEASGSQACAARELQKAQWWLTYSVTLTQTAPDKRAE